MKARYLLLFGASLLFANPIPSISIPVQIAYETRTAATSADAIYQRVNPAVVTVYAGREIGSGSIVSSDGLVITNNHVVREVRTGGSVAVRTANGGRIAGQVVATDSRYDLALIQLSTNTTLPTVAIANSNTQTGEAVFAIGSPYGRPGVMTTGTFASARNNGDLQSRVVLQPGNSGGPLLNAQGEMIGVNKAILESARGSNTGISIATSAQIARQFIDRNRPAGLAVAPPSYTPPTRRTNPPSYAVDPVPYAQSPNSPAIANQPINPMPGRFSGDVVIPTQPNSGYPNYAASGDAGSGSTPGNLVIPQGNEPGWRANSPLINSPPSQARVYQYPPEARYDAENQPNHELDRVNPPAIATGSRLGVIVDSRTLVVQQVEMGSAAANSGLRVGDRLIGANGSRFGDFDDLQNFMQRSPSSAEFTIDRNGRSATVGIQF